MMQVAFIHGPPACGKHTIGRAVADRLGWPLFHNHLAVDLALALFEFGSPGFRRLREATWLEAFAAAAAERRSFVFTFHPEATVDPAFIGRACGLVTAAGGSVRFVELTCADEQIERRLGEPGRARFGKLRSVEFYRQLRDSGAFAFPPLPTPLLSVATDRMDAEQAAALIATRLAGP